MPTLADCKTADFTTLIGKLFEDLSPHSSVESAAKTLVKGMCSEFRTGEKSDIVLSRVFHSFDYELLPSDIQTSGTKLLGSQPDPSSKFLVLIGSYGDEADWQDRKKSNGHQAIPLNRTTVTTIPMVARLFQQVGFDLGILLGEKKIGIDIGGVRGSYGVFHVPKAQGSPFVPAQDFVVKNGIQSVVGTGVMLPDGDVGIYLAFSRVPISETAAATISSLMSLFWQKIFPLRDKAMFD